MIVDVCWLFVDVSGAVVVIVVCLFAVDVSAKLVVMFQEHLL